MKEIDGVKQDNIIHGKREYNEIEVWKSIKYGCVQNSKCDSVII